MEQKTSPATGFFPLGKEKNGVSEKVGMSLLLHVTLLWGNEIPHFRVAGAGCPSCRY